MAEAFAHVSVHSPAANEAFAPPVSTVVSRRSSEKPTSPALKSAGYGVPTTFPGAPDIGIVGLWHVDEYADLVRGVGWKPGAPLKWPVLVSCLSRPETQALKSRHFDAFTTGEAPSLRLIEFAIGDRQPPALLLGTIGLALEIESYRAQGRPALLGCGAGCGRSGTLAACVLASRGRDATDAIKEVHEARSRALQLAGIPVSEPTIEEASQQAFVEFFRRTWMLLQSEATADSLLAPTPQVLGRIEPLAPVTALNSLESNETVEAGVAALLMLAAYGAQTMKWSDLQSLRLVEIARAVRGWVDARKPEPTLDAYTRLGRQAWPVELSVELGLLRAAFDRVSGVDKLALSMVGLERQLELSDVAPTRAEDARGKRDTEHDAPDEPEPKPTSERVLAPSDKTGRQPAPSPISPSGARTDVEITPDKEFEDFIMERTAKLSDPRKKTVTRLARSSFYGRVAYRSLFPVEASTPPDITYADGREKFAVLRPLYHDRDIQLSEALVREFAAVPANLEKMRRYRQVHRQNTSGQFRTRRT